MAWRGSVDEFTDQKRHDDFPWDHLDLVTSHKEGQSAGTRSHLNHTDAKEPQKESDTFNELTKACNKLQDEIILYMYF